MSTASDALLDAIAQIERAAADLGTAVRTLRTDLDVRRQAAFAHGGRSAVDDFDAIVGPDRVTTELAGVLVAAGLRELLVGPRAASLPPVSDLRARYATRLARGQLTPRRSHVTAPPGALVPGQHPANTKRHPLPTSTRPARRRPA